MPADSLENTYYAAFIVFFIDVTTETVLKAFYSHVGGGHLEAKAYLSSRPVREKLEKVIPRQQFKSVCSSSANPDTFDLSLLIKILTCGDLKLLQQPSHGWNAKPLGADVSTAADLLRLRDKRNKIVAHRHKAKFSKEEFEKNFQEVEDILRRITKENDPNSVSDLERKIGTYKNIDVTIPIDEKKYFKKLQEWHDDLKKQVEKVLDGLTGLTIFFEKSDVKHKKYIKFLSEGGRLVLSVFLQTTLDKGGGTIEQMLIRNRDTLKTELVRPDMIHQLYPSNEVDDTSTNTDVALWSLLVLAKVILVVFHSSLRRNEKKNIESIAKQTQNVAQTIKLASNKDSFANCCANLRHNILSMAESLDEETEKQVEDLINRFELESEHVGNIDEHFRTLGCQGFESFIDIYKESIKEFKETIKQLDEADMHFETERVFKIKFDLLCKDEEKGKLAGQELTTILKDAIRSSGTQTKSEQYVHVSVLYSVLYGFIRHLKSLHTVKPLDAKESCVILSITCQSKQGILQLVNFVEGPVFQNHLTAISNYFEGTYQEIFVLTGYLTLDSLQKARPDQIQSEQMESVELSLSYTSPEETEGIEGVEVPFYQREMLTGRTEKDYSSYMTRSKPRGLRRAVENLRKDNAKLERRIQVLESVRREDEKKLEHMKKERISDL